MAKHAKISVDDWIDRFVEHINRSYREPKFGDAIPAWLRIGIIDSEAMDAEYEAIYYDWRTDIPAEHLEFDWQIQKADRTPWIDELEAKLSFPFPPSFRSLVRRYVYPDFTIGSLWLLANTGESLFYEMSDSILRDEHLSKVLVKHGYLHFARPETGDYDPICFDTRRRLKGGEYPIVRVEHEAILCFDRIGDVWEVAPSFLAFVVDVVEKAEAASQRPHTGHLRREFGRKR